MDERDVEVIADSTRQAATLTLPGHARGAAARREWTAVVSRGGRPNLTGPALALVRATTLLIVGGADVPVIELNRQARAWMRPDAEARLQIVPGATHLFEEPGALEMVARLATDWFRRYTARA